MSVSHRKFRAAIYWFEDVGTEGLTDSGYRKQASSASDGSWACSLATPTGNEVTVGLKPEARVDIVIGLSIAAPVQAPKGQHAAIIVDGGEYLVQTVLPRQYGISERQVYASKSVDPLKILPAA